MDVGVIKIEMQFRENCFFYSPDVFIHQVRRNVCAPPFFNKSAILRKRVKYNQTTSFFLGGWAKNFHSGSSVFRFSHSKNTYKRVEVARAKIKRQINESERSWHRAPLRECASWKVLRAAKRRPSLRGEKKKESRAKAALKLLTMGNCMRE